MRRELPGINAELAAAVGRVNELYVQVPEPYRPDVSGERWQALEAEVDRACGGRDREAALAAIAAWEEHAERVLSGALLHAPLEAGGRP